MDVSILLFLTSGLFLGWSLGANDAANIFGTAVGTRMLRFRTAAIVGSVFVILGAVISGAGASHTLGKLGSVTALGGSFTAALSAAIVVFSMTRLGIPVSTTQAIVGAIIGWNWFSQSITDTDSLIKILITWIVCPLLAALVAVPLFAILSRILRRSKLHILRLDAYTRVGLLVAGAFGAYSLGANNISNVMGVFVPVSPFTTFHIGDLVTFTSIQQLFLLGAVAIAVGIFTYSKKVMMTVGDSLFSMSPVAAWVVVVAHSVVLFMFSSVSLENFLASHNLPTIPLVPVSSSQAVIGAVTGIGLYKGGKNINWRALGTIASGWVATPIVAAAFCFISLFVMQNVFDQKVYEKTVYQISPEVVSELDRQGISSMGLNDLVGLTYDSAIAFRDAVRQVSSDSSTQSKVVELGRISPVQVSALSEKDRLAVNLSASQSTAVKSLRGRIFEHTWQLENALSTASIEWQMRPAIYINKKHNNDLRAQLNYLDRLFQTNEKNGAESRGRETTHSSPTG